MRMIRLSLFGFFLMVAHFVSAQSRIDCNAMHSRILGRSVSYCVMLPAGYDAGHSTKYPVLYFLHGLGENEQMLFKMGGWQLIEDLRQQHKIGDFLIVTPDAKATFYINSANGEVRYSDFFLREFIPHIEGAYRIMREPRDRAISGISMGGYGALRFAFAYPELFSAVSAESAALMIDTPRELDVAMSAGTPLGNLLGSVFGNPINVAHWGANNPFVLARKNRTQIAKLAIYFNCGEDDQFGFEHGAEALNKELQAEGIKRQFHLYPGDHSAAYFLSHLGEVIEFHSRAFESSK